MKRMIIVLVLVLLVGIVCADTWVKGYYKSDGTYVAGHYRTETNKTNHDNYSTSGNTNTFTGTKGTVAPDYSARATKNNSKKEIQTGPRGGQYYINRNGNKTYVPKSG